MKLTRKLLASALAVLMSVSLLAGCGSSDSSSAPESTASNAGTESKQDASEGNNDESKPAEDDSKPDDSSASAVDSAAAAADLAEWNELGQTEITAAMGAGWNLGNQLEALSGSTPSETAWGNPVITKEMLELVKAQGFSTVRIPVTYLSTIGEGPDYTIDSAWLDRVEEVVNYALDSGLYAIINMHGDGYYSIRGGWLLCADDNQEEIRDKYSKVWGQIAERFKDYDEHLIFESMNEEFNGVYGDPDRAAYENINAYNQTFVDTVRQTGGNNGKRWLLLPGWNTDINFTVGDYGFAIPTDEHCESDSNRIMISVHFYDPYNFTIDESDSSIKTQWGKGAKRGKKDNWGQEAHVDKQMKALNDAFVSKGYPVVIGEMGCMDRSDKDPQSTEFRAYWYEYVCKQAKLNGAVPVIWDNGWNGKNALAFFDRHELTVSQPELVAAVIRAMTTEGDYEIEAPVTAAAAA